MSKGISVIIPVYNCEATIRETLDSVKDIADEIIVVHDGYCYDRTLEICEEYGARVYSQHHKGRSAFTFATGLKKAKYDWILKLDDDESLSKTLQNNIKKLIKTKKYDAFSFIHPLWDGKKMITKTWPRKTALVRKNTIRYFGFPGMDMNIPTKGKVYPTKYIMKHKPLTNQDVGWEDYKKKVLGKYLHSQVEYMFKKFTDFPRYGYKFTDFPTRIRLRKKYPILFGMPYAVAAFFKHLFYDGAVNEGKIGVETCVKSFIYNLYLNILIKEKKKCLKKD